MVVAHDIIATAPVLDLLIVLSESTLSAKEFDLADAIMQPPVTTFYH